MLHDFTQLGLQEKENLLSCYPHSKTHHTAPKTGFVDCLNSLEAWFFLKKNQISWPVPQNSDLDIWGGAQESTFIKRIQ